MNDLIKTFKSNEFGIIRTTVINGDPYFVGKDVASVLRYENPTKAVRDHVSEEDRAMGVQNVTPSIIDSMGREQFPTWINESGLYSLVLSSKLPGAKRFKHWVTSEVLPAIRKHGLYAIDEVLNDPDMMIAALQALKEERAKRKELEDTAAVQAQQLAELQPKASYYDVVLACKDLISIGKIAKDYGWSAQKLNEWLADRKIQYKQGSIWLLYQKYANRGYTSTKTYASPANDGQIHSHVNTYWTQKGRLFIYDSLKAEGILPTVERTA